mmetsp:Transcript_105266/g.241348  ORF Transcript_105266/g.241348 Transcript_105266/m.241348 type:complete len:286 (+) Transcript_105266:2600-3457(+)
MSPRKATTLVFIRWSLDKPSAAPVTDPRRPSCNTRVLRMSFSSLPSAVSSWSVWACLRTTVPSDVSKARPPVATPRRGVRARTPTIILARRSAAVRDFVRLNVATPGGPSAFQPSAGKLLYFPAVRPLLSVCVLWKFLDSGALRTGAVMAGNSIGTCPPGSGRCAPGPGAAGRGALGGAFFFSAAAPPSSSRGPGDKCGRLSAAASWAGLPSGKLTVRTRIRAGATVAAVRSPAVLSRRRRRSSWTTSTASFASPISPINTRPILVRSWATAAKASRWSARTLPT